MSLADSACVDSSQTDWMLSSGRTPCEVLESLVQVCSSSAAVQHLSVDASCTAIGANSTSPCCCSTVTYALVAACWVCQTSQSPSTLTRTYTTWLSGCSSTLNGSLPSLITSASPQIPVPGWALVQPPAIDAKWNISRAQLAANYTPSATTSASGYPSSTTTPLPPRSGPPRYVLIAVCSALALVLLLGMATWLYRRRNRVSHLSRPPPDFEIDGTGTELLPKDDPGGPKRWAWWTRRPARPPAQGNRSDPSKIDAWRYPFDYTPVSVGSSASGSGRARVSGGYYDPYYPYPEDPHSRRSETHLRPRQSMDNGVRGSSATLHQYHSTTSLLPGSGYTPLAPSPGLGHSSSPTPATAYPPSTPGLGHAAPSQFNMPPGYTPSAPTYSTTQYYTYPVPSTSTMPPLSPQHVHLATHSHTRSHAHTHTVELRLSPEEYERLCSMYPEMRVQTRRRRRRRDRNREGGVAESGSEAEPFGRGRPGPSAGVAGPAVQGASGGGRPRSWSVPAGPPPEVETEEEVKWDGRPRNGIELREKYGHGRKRGVAESGTAAGGRESRSGFRLDPGGATNGGGATASGTPTSGGGRNRERDRLRAVDGGISLMGGPPRR